jgi:hypothetical protein
MAQSPFQSITFCPSTEIRPRILIPDEERATIIFVRDAFHADWNDAIRALRETRRCIAARPHEPGDPHP